MRVVTIFMTAMLLAGCGIQGLKQTKQELKYGSQINFLDERFSANYQYLSKCWDENRQKNSYVGDGSVYSNVYTELNMAEMFVRLYNNQYAVLIEMKKKNENETIVSAWGSSQFGLALVPQWMGVLRECEARNIGLR